MTKLASKNRSEDESTIFDLENQPYDHLAMEEDGSVIPHLFRVPKAQRDFPPTENGKHHHSPLEVFAPTDTTSPFSTIFRIEV